MKKWYKSAVCKGILVLAAHVSVITAAICLFIGIIYPGQNYGELLMGEKKYAFEDTKGFADELEEKAVDVLELIRLRELLCTEGELNLEQIVDVEKFYESGEISEGPGEVSYTIRQLIDMYSGEERENIIVCERTSGELKYNYAAPEQFVKECREQGYTFPSEETEEWSTEDVLHELEEYGQVPNGSVLDKEGNEVYKNIWQTGRIYSDLRTVSGKTVLEIANESAEWNGRLTELLEKMDEVYRQLSDSYWRYKRSAADYSEGETNLSYLYIDYDTGRVETNRKEYGAFDLADKSIEAMMQSGRYVFVAPTLAECKTNLSLDNVELPYWKHMVENAGTGALNYKFIAAVDTEYPIQDSLYTKSQAYMKYMPWADNVIIIGIMSAVIFLICVVWLTAVAGRSNNREDVALLFFDRWKTEIWFAVMAFILVVSITGALTMLFAEVLYGDRNPWYLEGIEYGKITAPAVAAVGTAAGISCCAVLTAYLSLVRVIKARTIWKNSILRWFVLALKYLWSNRSAVTKSMVLGGGLFFVNLLMVSQTGFIVLMALGVDLYALIKMAQLNIEKGKIKKGVMRIAAGDTEYKIPTEGMSGDNRDMAEMINHIGEGIQNAVEKSLKDERLKTDLITNVSHDIKTPLTSIINYVGLLKQENFEDPKIQRYLDILDQKSQRLKTLTEDVVEASKISSGNINLEFINLNLVEMIHQTTGEFAEKFEKKGLTAVVNVPEEPAIVRVDGRRMWRVIENIYNNAAKYAMPGTRVYADLSMDKSLVVFSLKNVSEYPLNITADELTERFIRGDVSRSTEGSGLGLSIAQNLTQMQGGEFKLYVDGDLFKVTVTFPRIRAKEEIV